MKQDYQFWQNKIKAFLHDPPDKVLKLIDHDKRARGLLNSIGLSWEDIEADRISSSLQRLIFESGGKEPLSDFYALSSGKYIHVGYPVLKHPITGCERKYENLSKFCEYLKKTNGYSKLDQLIGDILNVEIDALKALWNNGGKRGYIRVWNHYRKMLRNRLANMLKQNWSNYVKSIFGEKDIIYDLIAEEIVNLPADTRCPDHTIWDHLDATSAIHGAMQNGSKLILLMFKISPVQDFIKNARKERDLWAGSHLLSFLTFQAIKVVVDKFGPDAVIFPHLRDQPFFSYELFENTDIEKLKVANIPNKFLALVNIEAADKLEKNINDTINTVLKKLLEYALKVFNSRVNEHMKNHYLKLLQNYFNITVCSIPADLSTLLSLIEKLPNEMQEKYKNWIDLLKETKYRRRELDLYSLMFELLEEIIALESRKFVKIEGLKKEKCSLCGDIEVIGNRKLWENIDKTMFKENEMLCPVCLVKRMYPNWIKEKWGIEVGFESVSEIALRKGRWLEMVENSNYYLKLTQAIMGNEKLKKLVKNNKLINPELLYIENWNSKYLQDNFGISSIDDSELESIKSILRELYREFKEPEKYYAILMMDGDDMGKMLMGDEMRSVNEYIHPGVLKYVKAKEKIEKTKRLITPATHSAISRALAHFSINIVPKVVNNHRGELIYAGGDDVLALLPIDLALACAYKIQDYFRKDWDGWNILPGKTMSAGILIVHYKHPLYDALDKVRELEKKAKEFGRDAVAIGYLTRGGSYNEVVFNWKIVDKIGKILKLIKNSELNIKPSLSKRIIYHVVQEVESLPDDENALREFLKFEFLRHYSGDKKDVDDLVKDAINLAKNIRINLTIDDFEGLGVSIKSLVRINSKVNRLIRNGELSADKIYEELRSILNINHHCERFYGLILKKQVRNLFILLKILVDCDAEV